MLLAGSLKPNESLTQLVSGLIVVLTFTLAASVATGGGQQVARSALVGAIAANVSWGIISDSQRREASRLTNYTVVQVRPRDQSQDRESARPDRAVWPTERCR
jgi:hypothetical protein